MSIKIIDELENLKSIMNTENSDAGIKIWSESCKTIQISLGLLT